MIPSNKKLFTITKGSMSVIIAASVMLAVGAMASFLVWALIIIEMSLKVYRVPEINFNSKSGLEDNIENY